MVSAAGEGTNGTLGFSRHETEHVDYTVEMPGFFYLLFKYRKIFSIPNNCLVRALYLRSPPASIIEHDFVATFNEQTRDTCADETGASNNKQPHTTFPPIKPLSQQETWAFFTQTKDNTL